MDEFSTLLDPEEFQRVWDRVSDGRDSPVVPRRPPQPERPDRPDRPDRPPRPDRPDRPDRPPQPAPPPEPPCPLGEDCRGYEALLRGMIQRELERYRSAQSNYVPPQISAQALDRARRLAAALYLISGRWYLPRYGRREQWRDRRSALRGLYRQSQALERSYRREASQAGDRELKNLFRELANECAAEQHFLQHQLER